MAADSPARRGPVRLARAAGYRAFYRLPGHWRQLLVRYLKPRYTVGSIVLVRASDSSGPDRLLLVRQPSTRGWSLPGGLMNRHETPLGCAQRELAEETGLKVALDELNPATPNAVVHRRGGWIDMVFEARVATDARVAVDGAEVLEASFYRLDGLPPLTSTTARLLAHYGIGPYADYPEIRER